MTEERWYHITRGHPEMAVYYDEILEAVEHPEFVYLGSNEEVYENDGFIITSFVTNKKPYFTKKKMIWKQ